MTDSISGTFERFGDFGLIDGIHLVRGNMKGAANGDEVSAVLNSDNPNAPIYKITGLVGVTKERVENIVEGYFKETRRGFGFIKVLGQKEEIYVPKNSISGAKAGDKVRAVLGMSGGKEEALITEILDKVNPIFIGEVIVKNDKLFLELENNDVYIIKNIDGVKKGDILSVFLEKNETTEEDEVVLNEILGDKNDLGIQTVIIAARNGARIHFPQEVLDEANSLDGNIDEVEILNRVKLNDSADLRELFTVTIDGPTAKDKDDAISVKFLENGDSILYVSIADVTHYVKENFEIDNEALLRGNSLYYGDKVTPMIPERLSNDICSLNPDVEKLTVTCEVYLNSDGTPNIEKSQVYNSVIKSNHAVTYEEVDNIYNGKIGLGEDLMFGNKVSSELSELVIESFKLSEKIGKVFKKEGKLGINSTETKIILDEEKKPIGVEAYPKHDSNEVIENFMVIANNVVPQIMERKFSKIEGLENKVLPFIHRTHKYPNDNAVEKLKNILEVLDVDFEISNKSPETFSKLLDFIIGHPKEKFLTKKITTTLEKAIYTALREGHFGLALEYYSHFTSPIRRYADLQIHRIIKEILNGTFTIERYEHYISILGKEKKESENNKTLDGQILDGDHLNTEINNPDRIEEIRQRRGLDIKSVTGHSTKQEEMSEKNEKDVNKYLGVELLKDKIGMQFGAYIDDIDGKKIKIILDNTVTGIIDLSDNKRYDSTKLYEGVFKIKNTKTKEEIGLGDELTVILESADTKNMELYFKLEK